LKGPLNIAIYSGIIPSTTFIERLISGLSKKGINIYLFGIQKSEISSRKKVHIIGYRTGKLSKLCYFLYFGCCLYLWKRKTKRQLDSYLKAHQRFDLNTRLKCYPVLWHRPDMFHVQWAKGIDDWMWVQDFGIKLVLSLRGAHINYSPIANKELADTYKHCFPKLDGFHAVSAAMAKEVCQYGADPSKIQVVYSGLNLNQFTFEIKQPNKPLQLLSVGRAHWKKGYHYALDACKIFKDNGIKFHYTIIGAAGSIELAYQVKDLGLEQDVKFLPKQPFYKVMEAMRNADVLLMPSVEEGIANVVLEAMALGTLVVSTDCGGMAEVIVHGETGFLVPLRNAPAMAAAVMDISTMPQQAREVICSNARRYIEVQHSEDSMISDMMALYNKVLNDTNL
jgi:colanic acid/amylovoran biosynthesis glycosyltransferase